MGGSVKVISQLLKGTTVKKRTSLFVGMLIVLLMGTGFVSAQCCAPASETKAAITACSAQAADCPKQGGCAGCPIGIVKNAEALGLTEGQTTRINRIIERAFKKVQAELTDDQQAKARMICGKGGCPLSDGGCKKACCAKSKSCASACTKPCCATKVMVKAKASCATAAAKCGANCTKPCCAAKAKASCAATAAKCGANCTKPCCAAKAKASCAAAVAKCGANCTKPCCAAKAKTCCTTAAAKCGANCTKPCCAAKAKASCAAAVAKCGAKCTKPCCAAKAKTKACAAGCTKPCCAAKDDSKG